MIGDNAVLRAITAPGEPNDYGQVSAPGEDIWTGRVQCYLRYGLRVREAGDRSTLGRTTQLFLRRMAGAPAVFSPGPQDDGTTVLVEDGRYNPVVQRRFRVVAFTNSTGQTAVDSYRLDLEDERRG